MGIGDKKPKIIIIYLERVSISYNYKKNKMKVESVTLHARRKELEYKTMFSSDSISFSLFIFLNWKCDIQAFHFRKSENIQGTKT